MIKNKILLVALLVIICTTLLSFISSAGLIKVDSQLAGCLVEKDSVKTYIEQDVVDVLVLPCYNGYVYGTYGYDFNPLIEDELKTYSKVNVLPFPYKTLKGVLYQGIFDVKYCPPIIEKVDVDFLILTRFDKKLDIRNRSKMKWGYQIRIVNTKTLKQFNSIEAHDLKSYNDIEKHIKENIKQLKKDIENVEL